MSDLAILDKTFASFLRFAYGGGARGSARPALSESACDEEPSLRLALAYGELLRAPRGSRRLRVLSGAAWVSAAGLDHVLQEGECLDLAGARDGAVVSATRGGALLFELS